MFIDITLHVLLMFSHNYFIGAQHVVFKWPLRELVIIPRTSECMVYSGTFCILTIPTCHKVAVSHQLIVESRLVNNFLKSHVLAKSILITV